MATPDQDPTNLHDLAVDCQADLHKLAAGLVQAGVPPEQTDVINHMAQMVGTVAASLGQSGIGGPPQGGAPGGQPEPPQAAPAGPPGPAGAQPPASPQQEAVHHGIHGAVQMLHGAMQASKQQRGA